MSKKSSATAEQPKKKPVLKFRLRREAGPHFERNLDYDPSEPEDEEDNPRDYEFGPGDVVESRRRLDKIFPNKFQPVQGNLEPSQGQGGEDYPADEDPDADRPVRSVEHATRKQPGRYLSEDELEGKKDLQAKAKGNKKTKSQKTTEKFGDDVTDDFDGARDADFVVYAKDGKHTIVDADEPDKPLKKGIKKAKVAKALKQLQEE